MTAPPRVTVAVGAALLGFLAVLAATQPRQASRELRRLELVDLIRAEDARVRGVRARLERMRQELAALRADAGVTGSASEDLQARARQLAFRSGAGAVMGEGVVVVLDDSSSARSPTGDPNDLVIHERDIQTVVNALWRAGAEAVSIDGERLSPLSAVRCAGNTLLLHGTVHSPPYEIAAIGDARTLQGSFASEPGVGGLLEAADAFGLRVEIQAAEVSMSASPASIVDLADPEAA